MWDWEVDSYFSTFASGGVTGSENNHWWLAEPGFDAPSKLTWVTPVSHLLSEEIKDIMLVRT